jgi:lysophospholipase L1-like esterase
MGTDVSRFLKPGVVVANFAESGESLRSFKGARRLEKILSMMKPGDYLFIEFAHNDQKKGGSYVEPFTTYTDEVNYFIEKTREKGGKPVLVTSMHRRSFDDQGKIVNTLEEYPDAMRKIAADQSLPLIDLNEMSKTLYETLGPEDSKRAFVHYPMGSFPGQQKDLADNTHFSNYGAYQLAKCVVQCIREKGYELNSYIVADFHGYNPSKPDPIDTFELPRSTATGIVKPDGN